MKKIIITIFIILCSVQAYAKNFNLEKVLENLDKPWSLSFIDINELILTEKKGNLLIYNLQNKKLINVKHNLSVLDSGQGGLLDVLYHKGEVYVSYSENRGDLRTSTSVAKGVIRNHQINFKNIFRAEPPIRSGYHFGSRLLIKDDYLFITAGERGQGMIAQDPKKHPGSIIRIKKNGEIPKDNPKFKDKLDWLPEIFQIGVRNPQGIAYSPFNKKIYISNHGAKGGDWFGTVNYGENYGWKILGWGGTNYSGTKIGPKWKPGFTKAIKYWVPSIAISAIAIYQGKEFKEWEGDALITSLKDMSLRKLIFKNEKFVSEEVIFKNEIGRIRDIKIDNNGKIYLLSDNGEIWRMSK